MICLTCKKDFEPKRKTAKFCSPKCRVYAARGTKLKLEAETKSLFTPREVDLCEHLAGRGFCKRVKCSYSQFNPKNRSSNG